MDIEVDYNPTPSTRYFVSVGLNDKEAISFDNTTKGFRIIKQVLADNSSESKINTDKISGEWDAIVLKDGKFVKKYHVVWKDNDKQDIVNGEKWETVWEKPLSTEVHEKMLSFSRFVSDNYENLSNYEEKMSDFETIISQEVAKYQ